MERLLNRCDLFRWARILFRCSSLWYEAELLFTVQDPSAFRYKAVLARDPFLNFLIRGALARWLLLPGMGRRVLTSSTVIVDGHSVLRPGLIRLSVAT